MTSEQVALLNCTHQIMTALITKNVGLLNQMLAPSAEYTPLDGHPVSKYDWIDMVQNDTLLYLDFSTISTPKINGNHGSLCLPTQIQFASNRPATVQLQWTFIADNHRWLLISQVAHQNQSEKPISRFTN